MPEATDRLAALKHRRAAIGQKIAALQASRAALTAAETAESEALAAIGALGRQEVAAATEWASSGAAGAPPSCDHEARDALTKKLAFASAEAAAARGAAVGIDAQIGDAAREGVALTAEIEMAAVQAIADRFAAEWQAVLEQVAAVRRQVSAATGAISMLRNLAERHRLAGRDDPAMAIFRLLERMAAVPTPDFDPTIGEVQGAEAVWVERFGELLR